MYTRNIELIPEVKQVMNIFDVIGPVMIGPSSSHTAGAVRLGNVALAVLGEKVKKVKLGLHGSFAQTYRGHGTDLALLSGLMGWKTDDKNIPHSKKFAKKENLEYEFEIINLGESAHPNSVKFFLEGISGKKTTVVGASVGGGAVEINEVDGFPLQFTGEFPTVLTLHNDRPGIIAMVTSILSCQGVNIAQMKVFRKKKGGIAAMIVEADQPIGKAVMELIANMPDIIEVRSINVV